MKANITQNISRAHSNIAPIRVGVVGSGKMGQHHLRFYSMLNNAKLVGVVDVDIARAKESAAQYHCEAYQHIEDLIGKVDAVSIAVPSHLHATIGEYYLNHGIHCLIEKPLAISESECLKLIKMAEKKGVILLVGHVEHFNPAVQMLSKVLKTVEDIYAFEGKRMGFNENQRTPEVDVVLDLMIHDLQILNFLHDSPIIHIASQGKSLYLENEMDLVSTLLSFENGTMANLTASWVAAHKVRTLEVHTNLGSYSLDYSAQKLLYYKKPDFHRKLNQPYVCETQVEQIFVRYQEPLMMELQNFLQSIDAGVPLGVDGYSALQALKLAWKIKEGMKKSKSVYPSSLIPSHLPTS